MGERAGQQFPLNSTQFPPDEMSLSGHSIPHREAFVHHYLQLFDMGIFIRQNKITLEGGMSRIDRPVPKIVFDADVLINVPKVKPTRIGKWTLGFKNMFGIIPHEERFPWHRIPENYYLLTDLFKLVKPTLTVMDGLVIQEGAGPRFGDPVDLRVIVMGTDPVATEAVTVKVIGHEIYEQMILPIAEKYGIGTCDLEKIEVRGKSIESVQKYTKVSAGDWWLHPSKDVIEYMGGACWGCGFWVQTTPYPEEMEPGKKYALVVGNTPRIPEKFQVDEVIVMGTCAIQSKAKISKACPEGVTPTIIKGCPPFEARLPGYLKFHNMEELPYLRKAPWVKGD